MFIEGTGIGRAPWPRWPGSMRDVERRSRMGAPGGRRPSLQLSRCQGSMAGCEGWRNRGRRSGRANARRFMAILKYVLVGRCQLVCCSVFCCERDEIFKQYEK